MSQGEWANPACWGLAPAWSGQFYELEGEGVGIMAVHVSDTQTHRPPWGWALIDITTEEDSEVYTYRRTIG